jgi:hypothetical protein
MTRDPDVWKAPPFSPDALHVYGILDRRGRSMRIGPLRSATGLEPARLAAAINELHERGWVNIVWRRSPEYTGADQSRPLSDATRIVATRFGRWRFPQTPC